MFARQLTKISLCKPVQSRRVSLDGWASLGKGTMKLIIILAALAASYWALEALTMRLAFGPARGVNAAAGNAIVIEVTKL